MNKIAALTSLIACASAATGCATVLKSKQAEVSVTSTTPGADILVNGSKVGVTPATIKLSHKQDHTIVVRGSGGEKTCELKSGVSAGWVVLDLATVGGWLVDLVTDNWSSLKSDKCDVTL